MRIWPARLTASAACAASITARDTSPTRRLACIDAARSSAKASASLKCRPRISTPLARSTHLRSSSRASAESSACCSACSRSKRGTASASAARSAGRCTAPGSQAITRASSNAARSSGGCGAPTTSTGRAALLASRASAARSAASSPAACTTTACGASRTTSRTNMWHRTTPSTARPAACKPADKWAASAWADASSALTISRVIEVRRRYGRGRAAGAGGKQSDLNHTKTVATGATPVRRHPPVPTASGQTAGWHECCIAPSIGCNAAPRPLHRPQPPPGVLHLDVGCKTGPCHRRYRAAGLTPRRAARSNCAAGSPCRRPTADPTRPPP